MEVRTFNIADQFTYLSADISRDGEYTAEVNTRIAKAAREFGCLRRPIFQDRNLSIATKRQVYCAVVLPMLLNGAETWASKVYCACVCVCVCVCVVCA